MLQNRICKQCGIEFTGGPRAYYCESCRETRRMASNKEYKVRKKKGLARQIGSIDICIRCGKEYSVNAGQQRFCQDCQKDHNLEHDRITGLKYYHLNKENINPVRNIRRQNGPIKCDWCGKEFITHTRTKTCSPECSRKIKNHRWNIWRNSGGKLKKYETI